MNTCVESAESSARQLGGMENRGGLLRRTCPETSSHWAQHNWTGSRGAAVWLLEIERLQLQKSQIPDFFFFNPSSQREDFRIYVFSYAYI